MKILAATLFSLAVLVRVAHEGRCGEADPIHPAKAQREECDALQRLINPGPPAAYRVQYVPAIKTLREKIIAYTLSHSGADLDGLDWGNAVKSVYMTSSFCEWKTVSESEANLREIWKILSQVKPADPKKAPDLCLDLAQWHIQGWSTREPQAAAACMDEAALRFLPDASRDRVAGWKFVAPYFEEGLILATAKLPPPRRAEFQQKRETNLLLSLQDESVPLETRCNQLASYTNQLYGRGEAARAASLLDAWWAKYGEAVQSPQFYSSRFHTACYGTGDWGTVRETLHRMDKLATAGTISYEDELYKLVVANFYKNIAYSEYELKRRAALANKQKMEAQNSGK